MNYFDILFAKYKFEKDHPPIIKRTTGNPIVLTDAADAPLVECRTEIQGSQDLHGYDKPWVGGSGKNKSNLPENTSLPMATSSFNIFHVEDDIPQGQRVIISFFFKNAVYASNSGAIANIRSKDGTNHYLTPPQFGMTANTPLTGIYSAVTQYAADFNDVLVYLGTSYAQFSAGEVSVMLQIGSTAQIPTSYEPYSNICPITAYTEGEIEVRGKNLLDESTVVDGEYLNDSGVATSVTNGAYYAQYIPVTSGKYTISFTKANDNLNFYVRIHGYNSSKVWQSLVYKTSSTIVSGGFYSYSFTVPSGISFIRFSFGDDISNVQIESGTTATDYEPYTSTTHTTTYPSAIYRGSEDVVNGEVENLSEVYSFTGSETIQQAAGNPNVFDIIAPAPFNINIGEDIARPWSHFKGINYKPAADMLDGEARQYTRLGTTTYFSFCNHNLSSVSDCAAWFAQQAANGTPVQLVPKKNPTTSSVTPTNLPIKSLSGYTHIESSTGELDITYLTQNYQNFVDIIENNFENNLRTRKGGIKPLDVFRTLEVNKEPEEEEKKDEKVEDVKK